jgi:hypothetical protein
MASQLSFCVIEAQRTDEQVVPVSLSEAPKNISQPTVTRVGPASRSAESLNASKMPVSDNRPKDSQRLN